jgi:uncharacterized protein (TIGR02611 family)
MKLTKKLITQLHKLLAILIGLPMLGLGIILIPVPGPGLLTCLLALFILSTAFDWPKPYLEKLKAQLKKIIAFAKEKEAEFNRKHQG